MDEYVPLDKYITNEVLPQYRPLCRTYGLNNK